MGRNYHGHRHARQGTHRTRTSTLDHCFVFALGKATQALAFHSSAERAFLFFLVAGPWYIWVGVETKFLWHKGFFFTHNLGRFSTAMENHSGPWFYYLLVIAIGSAPWSAFIGMTFLNAKKELFNTEPSNNTINDRSAIRLLATWIAVVLIFSRSRAPSFPTTFSPSTLLLQFLLQEPCLLGKMKLTPTPTGCLKQEWYF